LGWSLRRIEQATGRRRETISAYLKAAGIVVPGRGSSRHAPGETGHCTGGAVHRHVFPVRGRSACRGRGRTEGESGHSARGVHRPRRTTPVSGASWSRSAARRPRGARRHHDRARRRRPGGLRRRADGPVPEHWQVPAHAPLRSDARLLAQVRTATGLAVKRPGLGRAARAGVSTLGRQIRISRRCSAGCTASALRGRCKTIWRRRGQECRHLRRVGDRRRSAGAACGHDRGRRCGRSRPIGRRAPAR
jgi:hypothetical protein